MDRFRTRYRSNARPIYVNDYDTNSLSLFLVDLKLTTRTIGWLVSCCRLYKYDDRSIPSLPLDRLKIIIVRYLKDKFCLISLEFSYREISEATMFEISIERI